MTLSGTGMEARSGARSPSASIFLAASMLLFNLGLPGGTGHRHMVEHPLIGDIASSNHARPDPFPASAGARDPVLQPVGS